MPRVCRSDPNRASKSHSAEKDHRSGRELARQDFICKALPRRTVLLLVIVIMFRSIRILRGGVRALPF